jgi:hypothetical protein
VSAAPVAADPVVEGGEFIAGQLRQMDVHHEAAV